MRQGQQNRRGRNRSGGRKPQSALSRNFESNGPNVKIRGTAAHIAEKYIALARDAQSSGDIIVAESYLQHAEHYNRIIMAAQSERQNGAERSSHAGGNGRDHGDEFESDSDDDESSQPRGNAAEASQPAAQPDADQSKRRRRRPANGSGNDPAKHEANNGDGAKPAPVPQQSRRGRPKAETTRAKSAKANGANTSTDDSAPEGYSAS